jgi:hypothetical protein
MAFMLGQRGTPVASEATGTATGLPVATEAAAPPQIVTNTPTATQTPVPTPTATPTLTPTPTPTPIVVINHIKDLGRLETTEYAMQTVIDLENEPGNLWEQLVGSDKLALVAEGEVVAGFDLTKIEEGDIQVEGQSVIITLPAPEILYSRIDNEKTYVYERDTGLFVAPDKSLEGRARQLAEEALVDWALRRDIYGDAEKSGRLQIENLLRSLGFTNIVINIKEKEL